MAEIIDCEEFGEVAIRISSLMRDGELAIDERVARKGYLTTAFSGGQIILRATKFVGTIPLTPDVSVRIVPRANITSLSYMLARSRKAPFAIAGFSRGYAPKFVRAEMVERTFAEGLVRGSEQIARRGLLKRYIRPASPSPWRGRFLVAETIRQHASKGVRYRHEFDQSVLSSSALDNIAIKEALRVVLKWYEANDKRSPIVRRTRKLIADMANVSDWKATREELVVALRSLLASPQQLRLDYRDALWSGYALLHGSLPALEGSGRLNFDSLIVNVSDVFEAYVRRELADRLSSKGFEIEDGWTRPKPFFTDSDTYSVHPDIIVLRDGQVVAILDAKYKPDVSEKDRYEVLAFMDVMSANIGGFICPAHGEGSRSMGVTASGKRLSCLRVDLAAAEPTLEAERLAQNVERLVEGRFDFV